MTTPALPVFSDFVDGKSATPGEKTFDLVAPQDGRVIGRIAESGQAGVDRAVTAAMAAFSIGTALPSSSCARNRSTSKMSTGRLG